MADLKAGHISLMILSVVMVSGSLFFYYLDFGRGPGFTMMERRPGSGSGPGSTVPGRGPGFTMMERRPGSGSGPGSTVPGRGPGFTMMERRPGSGSGPGSTVPGRGPVFTMQKIRFTLLEQESRESLRGHARIRHGTDTVPLESTLDKRQKFQQAQVTKFCKKYKHDKIKLTLPISRSERTREYFQHMLVDMKSETVYCFVPKAGCTTLKTLFFEAQGLLPKPQVGAKHINQDLLLKLVGRTSFRAMGTSKRLNSLQSYFKFVMYRNPLERLLSGYRNKVEQRPLVGLKETQQFDWLRKAIFHECHPMEYKKWTNDNYRDPVNISFVDFIHYWLADPPMLQQSAHFRPISELCQPCRTRFDFYGNFKNFEQDATILIDRLYSKHGQKERYTASSPPRKTNTSELLAQYYGQLSTQQRRAVFHKLAFELDFYYHVFPEESETHKIILGIDDDVP